jgi:PBSX family phage portal protein
VTKLTKAWVFDDGTIAKADQPSTQLAEDPFRYAGAGESGLVSPPYSLDLLVGQLETNTLHYRCVKQKASDVAGRGFDLRPKSKQAENSTEGETRWGEFLESVQLGDERGDESFKERIVAAHEDYESVGWAILEVSRRVDGMPDGLWHVPAHTIRAHTDGKRYAQKRAGKTVWFKRFGVEGTINRSDGGFSASGATPAALRGNELIVIRNPTPRSTHYGLPDHIPAMAALAGWRAQAEFNVRFFDRNAMPSYAVVIEGAELSQELEDMIREHFEAIRGKPHATLVLPVPGIPGTEGGEASGPKVRFEKLSVDIKDASFRLYKQDNALEICIAHGTPPYRVGWPIMGSLGGNVAEEATQTYNDAIVQPRQETWEDRLAVTLLGSKGLDLARDWELKAAELDTRNELRDLAKAAGWYELDAITPNRIASFFGLDDDGQPNPNGDLYRSQLQALGVVPGAGSIGIPAELVEKRWTAEVGALADLRKRVEHLLEPARASA